MLSEDEAEAVLLGLRYVDQRGDEVSDAGGRECARQNLGDLLRDLKVHLKKLDLRHP